MAQYALPIIDFLTTDWEEGVGDGDGDAFDEIDEGFGAGRGSGSGPDDATTYWQTTGASPTGSNQLHFSLSSITDPVSSSGYLYRTRNRKSASGGKQIDISIELLQLAVSKASQTFTNVDDVWTTRSDTLSAAEADSITLHSNLRLRTKATGVGGGPGRDGQESAHEFECPDVVSAERAGSILQTSPLQIQPVHWQ